MSVRAARQLGRATAAANETTAERSLQPATNSIELDSISALVARVAITFRLSIAIPRARLSLPGAGVDHGIHMIHRMRCAWSYRGLCFASKSGARTVTGRLVTLLVSPLELIKCEQAPRHTS